jgi:FkbM family methyltransferase
MGRIRILELIKWLKLPADRKIFVDIGANIGTHSIAALNYGFSKAICLEPEPNNFMLLKINQILNNVDDRCVNFNIAASINEGHVQFEINTVNPGDHRVMLASHPPKLSSSQLAKQTISVPTIGLDRLLSQNNITAADISLVWIDTQGHEGHVLSSAQLLLDSGVPTVFEFWPFGLNEVKGYQLLRPILAKYKIIDANKLPSIDTALTIDDIDVMYESWVKDAAAHTDFLLMPAK